jgi:hypothetical protein
VLAAHGLLAALRDGTPAVLDVARFPVSGKNKTALLSAQGCRAAPLPVSAGQAAQDAQRHGQARYGIVTLFGTFVSGPHVL